MKGIYSNQNLQFIHYCNFHYFILIKKYVNNV